jgi:hypothetical protein
VKLLLAPPMMSVLLGSVVAKEYAQLVLMTRTAKLRALVRILCAKCNPAHTILTVLLIFAKTLLV